MKKFFPILIVLALLASCAKPGEIDDLQGQIDELKSVQIATIEQQIAGINGSLSSLEDTDKELKGYITALQGTAEELQKSINATNEEIDKLETSLKTDIDSAKKDLLSQLQSLRSEMAGELATVNSTLTSLQAKDESLEHKIADLKKYVSDELKGTKDWASATFATLEQYQGLVTDIAGIKADITAVNASIADLETRLNGKIAADIASAVAGVNESIAKNVQEITSAYTSAIAKAKGEIESAYTQALQMAITNSESSMQAWVNGQLTGYYTIAEMNAKLDVLAQQVSDGDIATLATLRGELAAAKEELVAAYQAAIAEAISENKGVLRAELAMQIGEVNGKVSALETRVSALEAAVATLRTEMDKVLSRIQSIAVVPNTVDGSVQMTPSRNNRVLFEIRPLEASAAIAKCGTSVFSFDAISSMSGTIKNTFNIPISAVSFDGTYLTITASCSSIPEEVKNGSFQANARLLISNEYTNRSSNYFHLAFPMNYVPVTELRMNETSMGLLLGHECSLSVTIIPEEASEKSVYWSSSDTSVATVDMYGKVHALSVGQTEISAEVEDKVVRCRIYVESTYVGVEQIIFDKNELSMNAGSTYALKTTIAPDNAMNKMITWKSSAPSIAGVSDSGVITALKTGEATITAQCGEVSSTCHVTVSASGLEDPVFDGIWNW